MLDVCSVIFRKYSLTIIGQIMLKMVPFVHNNKSLPLVELLRYNEFAQVNWRCAALLGLHLKLNPFKI